MRFLLPFIDGFIILFGVLMGGVIRFWKGENNIIPVENLFLKVMLIVLVIQTALYYFDLYELRNFRERKKTLILLLEALGASSIFLAIIYYSIPSLAIGRGILTISAGMIFLMAFLLRLLYFWAANKDIFKERVLIIGTGDLAQKIRKEILENGENSFEIVGFVDERREKVGKSI
jgi:FlaA1/EpsC-like NDP-sugar epimerase